jgi:hypothetical protein
MAFYSYARIDSSKPRQPGDSHVQTSSRVCGIVKKVNIRIHQLLTTFETGSGCQRRGYADCGGSGPGCSCRAAAGADRPCSIDDARMMR